jgi:hypothetical protein
MKHFGIGRPNVNHYTSPSAEREGSNGSIVFRPQIQPSRRFRRHEGYARTCNAKDQKRASSAQCGHIVGMLRTIFTDPQSSDTDSSFLMTDARL